MCDCCCCSARNHSGQTPAELSLSCGYESCAPYFKLQKNKMITIIPSSANESRFSFVRSSLEVATRCSLSEVLVVDHCQLVDTMDVEHEEFPVTPCTELPEALGDTAFIPFNPFGCGGDNRQKRSLDLSDDVPFKRQCTDGMYF